MRSTRGSPESDSEETSARHARSMVMSVVTWQKSRETCSHGAPRITGDMSILIAWNSRSTYLSKRDLRNAASARFSRAANHESTSGRHPSSESET